MVEEACKLVEAPLLLIVNSRDLRHLSPRYIPCSYTCTGREHSPSINSQRSHQPSYPAQSSCLSVRHGMTFHLTAF